MKRSTLLFLLLTLLAATLAAAATERQRFTHDWQFRHGAHDLSVTERAFDASGWRTLDLPHDWAIEGPFDESIEDGSTGKLPWKGEGWYRKTFTLEAADAGKRVYFDFDGVMAFPTVYVNGRLAGNWDYGYTPFRIDATDLVRWGEENVIAVHVDTRRWHSRWYPGAGIYRKVELELAEPVHLAQWGTRVTTNGDELEGIAPDTATITSTLVNHTASLIQAEVDVALRDPDGAIVAESTARLDLPAGATDDLDQTLSVEDPLLWDVEHPHLYSAETTVRVGTHVVDTDTAPVGFRTFAFTGDDGFHLNGRRVQLFGVNMHHDLGPLGGAFNRRAAERQLEIMREMGVNAIRTAHNTAAHDILELCDEMGLLVFNEVFDKWDSTAGREDLEPAFGPFAHRQIRATLLRDRNHPSVVVWSTGNEILPGPENDGITPEFVEMTAEMVREFDETRPVVQGCHIPALVNGENFAALDFTGWNYARRYARYREFYPDRPLIYSESASTVSTRGYYEPDLPDRSTDRSSTAQVSSYDLSAADWSDIPDIEFRLMEEDDFVSGEFVWTGFDYLGEPTPHAAEARSSYFGIVDLVGLPKDRFYLYRSHWLPDETTVHILPHWNWPERKGKNVPVFVYTNGDSAELFLNGRSLGVRRKGEVPDRADDLASGSTASASAIAEDHAPARALDSAEDTAWQAPADATDPWWQVDLGRRQAIRTVQIDTPEREKLYGWRLQASDNGRRWQTLAEKPTNPFPQWGGPRRFFHRIETETRHLRIQFFETTEDTVPALARVRVFTENVENDYYDVTYDYRLRWNEVPYEPGELRAVAYKDGEEIGETLVETTGAPAALRLSADRTELANDGQDLSFITVEAVDEDGRPHPLSDALVHFDVSGAGSIAAVGNGNPLSYEPFQADQRHLFYGKAVLIVRGTRDASGPIEIHATADGLDDATLTLEVE
ncbi:MAG: glycoside hydrolase family 2 TIM barrel-domain containing protein [Opitutales bacterium]